MEAQEVKTSKDLGQFIRKERKALGVTQRMLAMTSNTSLKFLIELEQGKPTCQLQKVLTVINTLGIKVIMKEK